MELFLLTEWGDMLPSPITSLYNNLPALAHRWLTISAAGATALPAARNQNDVLQMTKTFKINVLYKTHAHYNF